METAATASAAAVDPIVPPAAVRFWPGLVLAAAIALAATLAARWGWLQAHGISALTLAIVFGMVVGHAMPAGLAGSSGAGINFAKQRLLRLGIILYGLRLTLLDIGQVGLAGVVVDTLVLCSTFAIACAAGTRLFGIDRRTAMLIGAGSSICGAAAVMATEPVVEGRPEQVTVAVSTVVVFGTIAIFLYPLLDRVLPLSTHAYGLYAGSTIHEVAQVVAAGRAVAPEAADTAVIAKMVRVMMLAPFLVVLSALLARNGTAGGPRRGITVPWFAVGFVLMTVFHSLVPLPAALVDAANEVDGVLLAMAMAALGVTTRVSAIRAAGRRPLLLAALLFGWLIAGGLAINLGVGALLG